MKVGNVDPESGDLRAEYLCGRFISLPSLCRSLSGNIFLLRLLPTSSNVAVEKGRSLLYLG